MLPRSTSTRLTTAGGLLVALLGAASSMAAPPGTPFYTNQKAFLIPFTPEPDANDIQQLILNVSGPDDFGKTYRPVATCRPTQREFKFIATQDGMYWFAVQKKDSASRLWPANLLVVQPGLKICVDTLPPVIAVKSVPSSGGMVAVEYTVREENPELLTLRADYRAVGQANWTPIPFTPTLPGGQITWTPAMNGPWQVRVQMRDKAGNLGEQVANVTPPGAWQPNPDVRTAPPTGPQPDNLVFVSSMQFQLNYQLDKIGKSGLRSIDVWITDDEGRTNRNFKRFPVDKDQPTDRPLDISVEKQGRYGFWIVPVTGVGLAEEPRMAAQPQVWVEVDTTPPVVKLTAQPVVGVGADANKVTIYYQATDRFLKERPIKISYSKDRTVWEDVAKDLANTGVYEWMTQDSTPVEFYLKVEAEDRAGNTGSAMTPTTVKVDAHVPKASGIKVVVPGRHMP